MNGQLIHAPHVTRSSIKLYFKINIACNSTLCQKSHTHFIPQIKSKKVRVVIVCGIIDSLV